jgi:hypothetical protein
MRLRSALALALALAAAPIRWHLDTTRRCAAKRPRRIQYLAGPNTRLELNERRCRFSMHCKCGHESVKLLVPGHNAASVCPSKRIHLPPPGGETRKKRRDVIPLGRFFYPASCDADYRFAVARLACASESALFRHSIFIGHYT